MHYFSALFDILSASIICSSTEVNGTSNIWPIGPRARLEIKPQFDHGMGHKLILKKKNESLNLTCTAVHHNGETKDLLFDYTVDWRIPLHVADHSKIERGQGKNIAWLWFDRLVEQDSGNYTCNAITLIPVGQPLISINIYLSVKSKPTFCGSQWFRCRSTHCIMERYVCDGYEDCDEGEDESSEAGCSSDPCKGKIFCNGRCIPPEWCCDHKNCSTFGLRSWSSGTHEISYVQTAFYTVIGCAMAFMFIVTILIIAICRVQIKRAMTSRLIYQSRDVSRRPRQPMVVPMYDVDVYLTGSADNYPRGVNITYNINSGVQIVGRPMDPPPYSELIDAPPREGPPPPYVSCENLIGQTIVTQTSENRNPHQSDNSLRETRHEVPDALCTSPDIIGSPVLMLGTTPSYDIVHNPESNSEKEQGFDSEYVETDALLSSNSHQSISEDVKSKSYNRQTLLTKHPLNRNQVNQAEDQCNGKLDRNVPIFTILPTNNSETGNLFMKTGQSIPDSKPHDLRPQNVCTMQISLSKAGPSSQYLQDETSADKIVNPAVGSANCQCINCLEGFPVHSSHTLHNSNKNLNPKNIRDNNGLESSKNLTKPISISNDAPISSIETNTSLQHHK